MELKEDFSKQYNSTYKLRIDILGKFITQNPIIKDNKWPVLQLSSEKISNKCLIIGIFFIQSNLKYSILKNVPESDKPPACNYIDDNTHYFIEDETGSLEIKFTEFCKKPYALVSGMVLGFVGFKNSMNIFECTEIIYPIDLLASDLKSHKNLLIISNPKINQKNVQSIKVITDYLYENASEILFIGDCTDSQNVFESIDCLRFIIENNYGIINLVPGLNDPTSKMLPQLPFHELFFNKNINFEYQDLKNLKESQSSERSVNLLSNPSKSVICNKKTITINQELIFDMMRYIPNYKINENDLLNSECVAEVLLQILKLRYILPNAPDTLPCVPYQDKDPFIIDECDIIVTGGCDKPLIKEYNGKIIICVPDYSKTGIAILVNLGDNSIQNMCFEYPF